MAGIANISSENFDDKVVSLLHFEGPNNSTVFTDEKGLVWNSVQNRYRISTDRYKFGASSLYCYENGGLSTNTNFDVTEDFTIECFINSFGAGGETYRTIFHQYSSTSGVILRIRKSDNRLQGVLGNGVSSMAFVSDDSLSIDDNTWYHVSMTTEDDIARLFLNGIVLTEYRLPLPPVNPPSTPASIGTNGVSTGIAGMYIDDFRWTQACRYKKNFIPPTETLT